MIPVTVRYKLESVAILRSIPGIPYLLNIIIFSIFDSNFLDNMILIIPYSRDLVIPRICKLHFIIKVSINKLRLVLLVFLNQISCILTFNGIFVQFSSKIQFHLYYMLSHSTYILYLSMFVCSYDLLLFFLSSFYFNSH